MKKTVLLFVMSILVLISSAAYADDGYFACGSDITEFSGKTFENLVFDLQGCNTAPVFDGLAVTDTLNITGNASVRFISSSVNRLLADCSDAEGCEIGLDESTSIGMLELYPRKNSSGTITVNGTAGKETLPAFYSTGYLCEGQPEFYMYADSESELNFRLKDLEVFSDMSYIGETVIHAAGYASVTFDNVWLHRVSIVTEADKNPDHFRINTSGMTYIDLLESGISFELHNQNGRHFTGDIPLCSPIDSDYMRIGLMLLHSGHDLTGADSAYCWKIKVGSGNP